MKRILVTGAHGYIARSFCQYMEQFPEEYAVSAMSLRNGAWESADFSLYDIVLHTAGLAHVKETRENAPLYEAINRDLTGKVAERAKAAGVRQFIFMSSLSVYGIEEGVITPNTALKPVSSYGRSKLEAERRLLELETPDFRVVILRPPLVYGPGCKGNYQVLVKLAKLLPVCPSYRNQRSMVSIENLCAFIKWTADSGARGVFCPQDAEYVCTCQMICDIARANGRRLPQTRLLNWGPACLRRLTAKGKKAFGNLVYQDEGQRDHAGV